MGRAVTGIALVVATAAATMVTAVLRPAFAAAVVALAAVAALERRQWIVLHVDLLLDELLDVATSLPSDGHQGHRQARGAGAAGAADAVHIVFGIERHVVVEHGRHILDVQTARGHVGAHQQVHLAGLEGFQRLQALVLALVAVQGGGAQTVALQRTRQAAQPSLLLENMKAWRMPRSLSTAQMARRLSSSWRCRNAAPRWKRSRWGGPPRWSPGLAGSCRPGA
jgi:hypothetical protein